MAPLIVAWPGGIFPTANTVVKGGKRTTRKQKKTRKQKQVRKQKKRTLKMRTRRA
jgi:hypothetical protein